MPFVPDAPVAPPFMPNPWTVLRADTRYENPWIALRHHDVLTPAGTPGIYGVVQFKNQAVGVVPYEAGDIWLVGQYRFALGQYSWEIPEGGSPVGESPMDTARRELQEETGLEAAHYQPILQMHLSNSVTDEWGVVYLATGLGHGGAPTPEDTEDLRVQRRPLAAVLADVEAGLITDSLTVAAIYKLTLMQLRGELP